MIHTLQAQLKMISNALNNLSKQVNRFSKQIENLHHGQPGAVKPVKDDEPANEDGNAKPMPVLEAVYDVVKRSRQGISIQKIRKRTGLDDRQISNALYKLSKTGKITAKARGIYVKGNGDPKATAS